MHGLPMISDARNVASQESFAEVAPVVVGFCTVLLITGCHYRNTFAAVNATANYAVSLFIRSSAQQSQTYARPSAQRTSNQIKATENDPLFSTCSKFKVQRTRPFSIGCTSLDKIKLNFQIPFFYDSSY